MRSVGWSSCNATNQTKFSFHQGHWNERLYTCWRGSWRGLPKIQRKSRMDHLQPTPSRQIKKWQKQWKDLDEGYVLIGDEPTCERKFSRQGDTFRLPPPDGRKYKDWNWNPRCTYEILTQTRIYKRASVITTRTIGGTEREEIKFNFEPNIGIGSNISSKQNT